MKKFEWKTVTKSDVENKKVLLRLDLNVPLEEGKIADDFKLEKSLETLRFISELCQRCVVLTHLGRPQGQDQNLSTKNLLEWFLGQGFDFDFADDIAKAKNSEVKLIMLENLRFFSGEENCDQAFAKQLSGLGEVFVFDAFGISHRESATTKLLPEFFQDNKFIGPLMVQEQKNLEAFLASPARPYTVVMGGAKLKKVELIKSFAGQQEKFRPNSIVVGGALASQLVDENDGQKILKELAKFCQSKSVELILPSDFVIDQRTEKAFDIGPNSVEKFVKIIGLSQRVFCNGTMGVFEDADFKFGTTKVLQAAAKVSGQGLSIAGGGDCVRAVRELGLESDFSFVSTGGGATLQLLAKNSQF